MFGGMNANAGGWLGEFYVRRVFDLGVRAYLLCWPSLPWGLRTHPFGVAHSGVAHFGQYSAHHTLCISLSFNGRSLNKYKQKQKQNRVLLVLTFFILVSVFILFFSGEACENSE